MNKNKFIITIIIIISINAVAAFGWYYLASGIKSSNVGIIEIRREIKTNENKLTDSNSLKKLISKLSEQEEKINSVFLTRENIIDFIEQLEFIGDHTKTSLKFGQINVDKEGDQNPSFSFTLRASFEKLFHFLVLFENNPYAASVKTASFQKTKDGEWQARFDVLLNNFLQ